MSREDTVVRGRTVRCETYAAQRKKRVRWFPIQSCVMDGWVLESRSNDLMASSLEKVRVEGMGIGWWNKESTNRNRNGKGACSKELGGCAVSPSSFCP
ncbi:hypothetical protein R1flu_017479 [Riccia fluitans]|uniref:Uncharacterized protein n=1 Tax=Riccia fluitans TaxID=41844 RepID=A0ABD1ZD31_9MARC